MKPRAFILLLLLLFLAGCRPSEQVIQTAIAETLAAIPTPTATVIPPANTPERTYGTQALTIKLNGILSSIGIPVEVVDIRYEDGPKGENTLLLMETRSTDKNFDSFGMDALQALKFAHMQGFKFQDGLVAIKVSEYSSHVDRNTVFILDWNDALAWFNDEISTRELFENAVYLPTTK